MKTRALFLATALSAVTTALAAQQPAAALAASDTGAMSAPAVPAPAVPNGPRVRAEIHPVSFSATSTAPAARRAPHTLTISTLALVLLVIIVVLLVT